jgi:hypothetical protein
VFEGRPSLTRANDIRALQTAASLEALAVSAYTTALGLPFIGGAPANGVINLFFSRTRDHHVDHAKAINATLERFGAAEQPDPDPVLVREVNRAKAGLAGPIDAVSLAITIETAMAETYAANTFAVADGGARAVLASVLGVEAQHVAFLNQLRVLLAAGAGQLIVLDPANAARLPAAAGGAGLPFPSFLRTDQARPTGEGARR